jgi:2-polyprenyl-6-methoxyphenol hydroxylase-like FAD-dependent oxidoreductase
VVTYRRTDVNCDVVVAGAGPVGLSSAAVLIRHGISTAVIEAQEELGTDPRSRATAVRGAGHWRASTFHPPTVELLEEVDVTDRMLAAGLKADRFQYRDRRAGLIAEFDLNLLKDDTRYPFRLQLNQQALVFMLAEQVSRSEHGQLLLGSTVVGVEQTDHDVTVEAKSQAGTVMVHGRFLLAADGGASTVRQLLGVPFEGMTYPEDHLLISTPFAFDAAIPGLAYVNYVADPIEPLFILRTEESWRVGLPLPAGSVQADGLDDAFIQQKLQGVVASDAPYEIWDRRIYNVHQRLADRFRIGRVLLIGDAAHVNSPAGGMGLNGGIHDAFDAARRLARIFTESSPVDPELDAYATRRRSSAKEHVAVLSHRNVQMVQERDEEARAERQRNLAATAADPVRAREWLRNSAMLAAVEAQPIGAPV